jgi:hypothetical protein
VFANGWLNIERVYAAEGWKVTYDRPDYTESHATTFTFKGARMTEERNKSLLVRGGIALGAVLGLAVLLPIIYSAFLAGLGLLGIAVIGLIGAGLVQSLPLLGQKWENNLLGWRKAEARKNPIEQMENDLIRDGKKLEATRGALETISAQIQGLGTALLRQKKADAGADYADMERGLEKMDQFYQRYRAKYNEAQLAFQDKKLFIERQKFKWGFAQQGQKTMALLNAQDAESLFNAMLTDEAYKQVDLQYNRTFAALDLETTQVNTAKQLQFGGGQVIDVSAIQIPVSEPARR